MAKRVTADGYVISDRRLIQSQYRLYVGDQRWRAHQPVYPSDPWASCTAVVDGREITVVFGWHHDRALLWRSDGIELVSGDRSGRLVDANQLPVIADLAEGPVELDGPKARWRWRVVS
jgi:hypothetical protein